MLRFEQIVRLVHLFQLPFIYLFLLQARKLFNQSLHQFQPGLGPS